MEIKLVSLKNDNPVCGVFWGEDNAKRWAEYLSDKYNISPEDYEIHSLFVEDLHQFVLSELQHEGVKVAPWNTNVKCATVEEVFAALVYGPGDFLERVLQMIHDKTRLHELGIAEG